MIDKQIKKSKAYIIYLIIAASAFLICSVADYYLEYMGNTESVELSGGIIDTGWAQMDGNRFVISNTICGLAVPFSILGLYAIIQQIKRKSILFAKMFGITMGIGFMIEVSTHGWLCALPLVYKQVFETGTKEQAVLVVERLIHMNIVPFIFGYAICLTGSLMLMIWTMTSRGIYSKWMIVCNELVFLIVGVVLQTLNKSLFEFAYVGSASRGLAAMFVVAAIYEAKRFRKLNLRKENK